MAIWRPGRAPFDKGDEEGRMMAGTLCSLWADIDWEAMHRRRPRQRRKQTGRRFPRQDLHARRSPPARNVLPRSAHRWRQHRAYFRSGFDRRTINHGGADPARKSLVEYERYYKEYLKGFEKMELVATAAQLGARESAGFEAIISSPSQTSNPVRSFPMRSAATTTRWTFTPPSRIWPATSSTRQTSRNCATARGKATAFRIAALCRAN